MAVTKRIIWVDDEDWSVIRSQAEAEGKTISVLIRERSLRPADRLSTPRPAPKPSAKR